MTKQELNEKIKVQQEIISKAKAEINSFVKEYIKSLPIKVDDKCKDSNGKVCWIASIEPRLSSYFSFSLFDRVFLTGLILEVFIYYKNEQNS